MKKLVLIIGIIVAVVSLTTVRSQKATADRVSISLTSAHK